MLTWSVCHAACLIQLGPEQPDDKRLVIGSPHAAAMDSIRIGLALRALRIRLGWRQADLAARVGVSQSTISAIERGRLAAVSVATLERVAAALGARLNVSVQWRGEQLDRLLDEAHAALVEIAVRLLRECGWDVAVEVSFAIAGERGSIDVLAFHLASGTLLVVEVKSVVPDSQATLHVLDRKVRLAPRIAAERGWQAVTVGRLLIVGDGSTARRRIARLDAPYGTALPDRGQTVRRWLRRPVGPLAGLLFLPYNGQARTRRTTTGVTRVRRRKDGPRPSDPRHPSASPLVDDKLTYTRAGADLLPT